MSDVCDQLADKVLFLLREAENTLDQAILSIELMRPLISDPRIIEPLDRTFAANALNALSWTLFSRAAMDAVKAIIDTTSGSASIAAAMSLLNRPEVLGVLRARRTAPIKQNILHDGGLPPEILKQIEERSVREEQERAAREFDAGLITARKLFAELCADEVMERLRKARNKVMAHTDTVLGEDGAYRSRQPQDFGLKWGDAEHATRAGVPLLKELMIALFGIGIAIDEVPSMFARYSEDFWQHFRTGIAISGGGPDKPVRPKCA